MEGWEHGSVCTCQPTAFQAHTLQKLLVPSREAYSCYPGYQRTPTANMMATHTNSNHGNGHGRAERSVQQTTTLQSVLRGEIPAAYSHLASQRAVPPSPPPPQRYSSPPVYQYPASPAESLPQEEPIDLSCKPIKSEPQDTFVIPSSGLEDRNDFSLLRNLLCIGKVQSGINDIAEALQVSDVEMEPNPVTGSTKVTLAKKNMFPVSSRVSDWLVRIIQFSKSIPEFLNLSHNDKVTLILNSWTRLLLLYMAENNFQFAVTPLPNDSERDRGSPAPDEPTMKGVESIQTFIKKCESMAVDQKEFAFLRMAVLFNGGYVGLDRPDLVDQLNSLVQQLLQQHVLVTRPNDVMHYSRLLLCLPSLYGINCKMIENIFCCHINGNMDMDVLLKEMLQNL